MSEAVQPGDQSSAMDLVTSPPEPVLPLWSKVLWTLCQCIVSSDHYTAELDSEEDCVYLPPQKGTLRNTLVLDLDETLVHASIQPSAEVEFTIDLAVKDQIVPIYIRKRPGLDLFLNQVNMLFEVVLFTASLPGYADAIVETIDPIGVFSARLYRSSCETSESGYIKDLSRLGRDLNRVLILDNCPQSYALQPENALPISSWVGQSSDLELESLLPMLSSLAYSADIPADLAIFLNNRQKRALADLEESTFRSDSSLNPVVPPFLVKKGNPEAIPLDKQCATDGPLHYSPIL